MQPMWNEVESSNISALAFEEPSYLFVRFNSGDTYRYKNVPREVFTEMLEAESVGKAFHRLIRSQPETYPFQKLDLVSE